MIRIAIIEDNTFLLKAIKEKLSFFEDIMIKWAVNNGQACVDKITQNHNIDLILMDIEMPVLNGIEATSLVKENHPQVKIIMLTVFDDDENIFKAIRAGADGYLLKEVTPDVLYKGIKDTLEDGAAMTPSIALKALKLLRKNTVLNRQSEDEKFEISKRETEVLEQLATGISYTKIADNLFVSPGTIRKHIENIYKKLHVHNKLEAVQKAKRNNLI